MEGRCWNHGDRLDGGCLTGRPDGSIAMFTPKRWTRGCRDESTKPGGLSIEGGILQRTDTPSLGQPPLRIQDGRLVQSPGVPMAR